MSNISKLYKALEQDKRLQKNWEQNQPRIDRALEGPLIARTPREVATAALLVMKLNFEEKAKLFLDVSSDSNLIEFARTQGAGGTRLANIIEGKNYADQIAKSAAIHCLRFYRNRSSENGLVRLHWSQNGLKNLASANTVQVINPAIKPTWALRKAISVKTLAVILAEPDAGASPFLRQRLRSLPGLGPERADAVGVFAFKQGWPICDEYLWRLMSRHSLVNDYEKSIQGYDKRRAAFESHWQQLLSSESTEPCELAATLYLWADEAERFGFTYEI